MNELLRNNPSPMTTAGSGAREGQAENSLRMEGSHQGHVTSLASMCPRTAPGGCVTAAGGGAACGDFGS